MSDAVKFDLATHCQNIKRVNHDGVFPIIEEHDADNSQSANVFKIRQMTDSRIFPEGAKGARNNFLATEKLIIDYPEIGHLTDFKDVRELAILRTPFSIIYRVTTDQIEVIRVWDGRADPGNLDL